MLPSPKWPKHETREPGSTGSPAHASVASPAQFVTIRLHLGKHASKPRRSSDTNNHWSTARVET